MSLDYYYIRYIVRYPVNNAVLQLYIMTLGCLAPYRRLGIGTKMLEHVLNIVHKDANFTSIFLHVQVNRINGASVVL